MGIYARGGGKIIFCVHAVADCNMYFGVHHDIENLGECAKSLGIEAVAPQPLVPPCSEVPRAPSPSK